MDALLVIDLQKDYFPGGKMELVGILEAAGEANRRIALAREEGVEVIFVRHIAAETAPFFARGGVGSELWEGLDRRPDDPVIIKHRPNSFLDTELGSLLKRLGVKELGICGAMSHMCVDSTARAASELGYEVELFPAACATRDLEFDGVTIPASQVHGAFMAALGDGFVTIL